MVVEAGSIGGERRWNISLALLWWLQAVVVA
jgi:hypothetical protein